MPNISTMKHLQTFHVSFFCVAVTKCLREHLKGRNIHTDSWFQNFSPRSLGLMCSSNITLEKEKDEVAANSWWTVREERETGSSQGHNPKDLPPVTYFLQLDPTHNKVLSPQMAPPSGDIRFNTQSYGDMFYSNLNSSYGTGMTPTYMKPSFMEDCAHYELSLLVCGIENAFHSHCLFAFGDLLFYFLFHICTSDFPNEVTRSRWVTLAVQEADVGPL